jgi:hypothetical protein
LQYKQKIRKENYKKGLCTCCGKKQHLKGKKTCIYCLSYTLRNRIAKGLCGTCGEKPLSPHSLVSCKDCLKGHRKEVSYANC